MMCRAAFAGHDNRIHETLWQWCSFRFAKNNRSKSVWTLFQRKRLNNQTVWPVIFGLTGPICARALKPFRLFELRPRGHHDWPVKPTIRTDNPHTVETQICDASAEIAVSTLPRTSDIPSRQLLPAGQS